MHILSGISQVPTRWQVEAAEQKAREEEEVNRIIAAEAKKKLIEVIINPDNYYGHDLPNVPYGTTILSLFYLNKLYYIIFCSIKFHFIYTVSREVSCHVFSINMQLDNLLHKSLHFYPPLTFPFTYASLYSVVSPLVPLIFLPSHHSFSLSFPFSSCPFSLFILLFLLLFLSIYPSALLVDWTDGFDESNCIGRFEPGVWGEKGGCGKRFEGAKSLICGGYFYLRVIIHHILVILFCIALYCAVLYRIIQYYVVLC